ncbi:DUF6314 family protein [Vreelandella malpeensis]|uniref:DUF6314 domain-containing protein n=1 Tax=Vreelandella malpeensis TaxID=1172368 RepID=A0ABS8DQ77_9GAMM|nr:DUF6314 family protein [Halomonas malpeensis]MCB8888468.1 hypothetical protein [Halomonas malpeensis]
MTLIERLQERLNRVRSMHFVSRPGPRSVTGWQGEGQGQVAVELLDDGVRFVETGTFALAGQASPVAITNAFRWHIHATHVALSHERRGADAAVHLFDLHPLDDDRLASLEGHQCAADLYTAHLTLSAAGIDLEWRIEGPKKDEWLHYRYA